MTRLHLFHISLPIDCLRILNLRTTKKNWAVLWIAVMLRRDIHDQPTDRRRSRHRSLELRGSLSTTLTVQFPQAIYRDPCRRPSRFPSFHSVLDVGSLACAGACLGSRQVYGRSPYDEDDNDREIRRLRLDIKKAHRRVNGQSVGQTLAARGMDHTQTDREADGRTDGPTGLF